MSKGIGRYPGGVDPAFIHLVGTIVTWWARTEGLMVFDVRWLRTQPMSRQISASEAFPEHTRRIIRHWGKLLRNGYAGNADKLAELEWITNKAFALLEHRNAIVHSFWPYGQSRPNEIELGSIKRKKGDANAVVYTSYTATVDQLDDVNNRLDHLYHRAMAFSFNAHKLAVPLPKDYTIEG